MSLFIVNSSSETLFIQATLVGFKSSARQRGHYSIDAGHMITRSQHQPRHMATAISAKLAGIALSSLGLLAIANPFKAGLAGTLQLEDTNNIVRSGIIDLPSTWYLRKGSGWVPANLTTDESVVLMTLCRLAVGANGGVWSSERLNAAISVLAFGGDPPDNLQATVYKTCMMAGDMDRRTR